MKNNNIFFCITFIFLLTSLQTWGQCPPTASVTEIGPYCDGETLHVNLSPTNGLLVGPGVSKSESGIYTINTRIAGSGNHTYNYSINGSGNYLFQRNISFQSTFLNITGTNIKTTQSPDNGSEWDDVLFGAFPIGFNFQFFGNNFTEFRIGTNGFITFSNQGSGYSGLGPYSIPNNTIPNNLIAFAWSDLVVDNQSTLEYITTGNAPNRKLVVNFFNVKFYGSTTTPNERISVQIQLLETSNTIRIVNIRNLPEEGKFMTLGIEDSNGNYGVSSVDFNNKSKNTYSLINETVEFSVAPLCETNTTTFSIFVKPNPTIPIIRANKTLLCNGDVAILSTSCGAEQVNWNNGATGNQITISQEGIYSAWCSENNCIGEASNAIEIKKLSKPIIYSNKTVVSNQQMATLQAQNCPYSVIWNNGQIGNSIVVSTPGNYRAICSINSNCQSDSSNRITLLDASQQQISINSPPCLSNNPIFTAPYFPVVWQRGDSAYYSYNSYNMSPIPSDYGKYNASLPQFNTFGTWNTINPRPELNSIFFLNELTGWAVGNNGVIMNTTNGGTNWNYQNSGSYGNFNQVFFINSLRGWIVGVQGVLLETFDGGLTWIKNENPALPKTDIISVYFVNENVGWVVGLESKILYTFDGGITWNVQLSNQNELLHHIQFTDEKTGWITGYKTGETSVYRTSDGGSTWIKKIINNEANPSDIHFLDDLNGWLVTYNGHVYRTINGGADWNIISTITSSQLLRIRMVDFNIGYLSSNIGIYKTTNGGSTWNLTSDLPQRIYKDTYFQNSLTGWVVSSDGTIRKTSNGANTFTTQLTPSFATPLLASTDFKATSFFNKNNGWLVSTSQFGFPNNGTTHTVYKTTNQGLDWVSTSNLTIKSVNDITFSTLDVGWVVGKNASDRPLILKTINGGTTWSSNYEPTNISGQINKILFINSFAGWAVGSNGLIVKTNTIDPWTIQNSSTTQELKDVFFLNTSFGWVVGNNGTILRTADGGQNWVPRGGQTTIANLNAVYFVNSSLGWATGENGTLLKSTNGGLNWSLINVNWSQIDSSNPLLTSPNFKNIYFSTPANGWITTSSGIILQTDDGGTTWRISLNFTNQITDLYFSDGGNGWVVGNNSSLLQYKAKLTGTYVTNSISLSDLPPSISISAVPANKVCASTPVTLSVQNCGGGTVVWTLNSTTVGNGPSLSIIPQSTVAYTATCTTPSCPGSRSASYTIEIGNPVNIVKIWDKTFGGTLRQSPTSIGLLKNGDIFVSGYSDSPSRTTYPQKAETSLNWDHWLTRINSAGTQTSEKTLSANASDILVKTFPQADEGYVFVGYSASDKGGYKEQIPQGSYDYWIFKTDKNYEYQWGSIIGGTGEDDSQAAIQLSDGGFLIGGLSLSGSGGTNDPANQKYSKTSPSYGGQDFWLVKVDQNGKKVWDKSFGGSGDEILQYLLETSDGNYLAVGWTNSGKNASGGKETDNINKKDYWIIKIDKNGNRIWDKTLGGLEDDYASFAIETDNNSYLIAGSSNSPILAGNGYKNVGTNGLDDIWLIELRSNGEVIREKNMGGTGDDYPATMVKTTDNKYLIGARSNSNIFTGNKTENSYGNLDTWVIKLDSDLNILWDKTYGGTGIDAVKEMILSQNNELIIASESVSPMGGSKNAAKIGERDFWIQKYWLPTPPKIFVGNTNICNGESTQIEALYCPGEVSWSNGMTGNVITVKPSITTTYSATCSHQGITSCSSQTAIINVCQSGSQSTFGYTAGTFQATDGGAAIYSIPIVLPSGSAGVKPELGIVYNSQGGNGILGVGWNLDGLQSINRSSKTRAQDEAFDVSRNSAIGVSLTKEDRYALNGSRLVLTPNHIQNTAVLNANYGAKGTEYYTEQNQFIRVSIPDTLGNGAPSYFIAYTKDGLILEFGNTFDSRIDSKEGIPITYLLNKVSDRNGNYILYTYEKEIGGNVSTYPYGKINTYPKKIEYTGGVSFSPYNRIDFEYIPRQDKQWSFIKGTYLGGGDKLLSKIKVSAKNQQGTTYVEVRRYELSYTTSKFTGNSILSQVKECADTLCHEPTIFKWQNEDKNATDYTFKELNSANGPFQIDANYIKNRIRLFGDWDGDGTNDLCLVDTASTLGNFTFYLNRYPNTLPNSLPNGQTITVNFKLKPYQFRTVDFNVDGKTDILFWNKTSGDSKLILLGYSGGINVQTVLKNVNEFIPASVANGDTLHLHFFKNREIEITDWNQDGITDLVSLKKTGSYYNKSGDSDIWLQTKPPTYTGGNSIGLPVMEKMTSMKIPDLFNTQPYNRVQIVDFNNDGLNDVCLLDTATAFITIYKANSIKIAEGVYDNDSLKFRGQDPIYSVQLDTNPIRYNWSPLQNRFIEYNNQPFNFYNRPFLVTDANGDGLPDIAVKMSETSYQFQISTGDFRFFEEPYKLNVAHTAQGGDSTVDLTDFNNDGQVDILFYNRAGLAGSSVRLGGFDRQNIDLFNPLDPSLLADNAVSFFFGNYSKGNLNDLLFYKVDGTALTSKIYNNNLTKSDIINVIQEGSGQEITITYKTLKDPSVYTRTNTQFKYPLFEFTAPISVLSSVRSKDGIGGFVYTDYFYEGAFSHSAGRGFRGFSKVVTKDRQRNTFDIKFYTIDANKWWLAGQPYRTELRKDDPANGQLLSLYEATFEAIPYTISTVSGNYLKARSYYTYGKVSVARTYDLNTTSQINSTTSRVTQDSYGNSLRVVVDHGNGVKDSTISQYTDNVSNWILGRLTRSTVFRASPGKPTSVRTVGFEYNATTGQLTKEITDPDSVVQIKREVIYSHDNAGNITQTEVKAWNGTQVESRITQTQFDTQKRLKLRIINPLGHEILTSFNVSTGSIITNTDINGLTDTYEHDAFQRIVKVTDPTGVESIERIYRAGATWNSPTLAKFVMYKKRGNSPAVLEHYDILGRMIQMDKINFSGNTISYKIAFNNKGEKTTEIGPGINKLYQYDLMSRVIRTTDYGENNSYEYLGNQTTVTDIKGRKRIIEKNSQGQLLNSRWESSNGTIANHHINYEYDERNNPTRVVGNDSLELKNFYDARGYKIKMEDPVMGTYRYENNGFGEMTKQIDPKGNVITMEYDKLGRVTKRTEPEGVTTYIYDVDGVNGKAKGKLTRVTGYGGIVYAYTYDNFGRTITESKTINTVNYTTSYQYTPDSKLDRITYPSGLVVKHEYNTQDYLYIVRRVSDNKVLWRAKTTNAVDNILSEDIYEKSNGQNAVLRHTYAYAADLSNVTQYQTFLPNDTGTPRINNQLTYDNRYFISSVSETIYNNAAQIIRTGSTNYTYDDLDQLTAVSPNIVFPVSGQAENTATTMKYDIYGNILSKSDVGDYIYDKNTLNGPRYLTRIDLVNPAVCVPSFKITTEYTSFNKVKRIANDSSYAIITYGPDRARVMQQLFVNNKLTKTKIYVSSLYEVELVGNQTKESSYIRGGSGVIAVENKVGTARNIQLWVKDHANNLVAVVDTNGSILQHLRYDVWGRRMNAETAGYADDNAQYINDRGFTKHEHLDLFQLINMNGRIYDPVIARFISPDPFIQDALDLQAYNRYAYVQNNPVMFTDPSGYFKWKKIFKAFDSAVDFVASKAAKVIAINYYPQLKQAYHSARVLAKVMDSKVMPSFVKEHWRFVVTTAATVVVGTVTGSGAAAGFTSGFLSSTFNGGSYNDAVKAGTKGAIYGQITASLTSFVAGATNGIQNGLVQSGAKAAGHAAVQGTMAEVQGGDFWQGAAAGAISGAASSNIDKVMAGDISFTASATRVGIAAVLGGTASALSGGKFANGAMAGAFERMYNGEASLIKNARNAATVVRDKAYDQGVGEFAKAGIIEGAATRGEQSLRPYIRALDALKWVGRASMVYDIFFDATLIDPKGTMDKPEYTKQLKSKDFAPQANTDALPIPILH
ncbi:YCF48-related protein [Emticicia sp. W12TSBA100-4]|uniref:YCF48-related protein n=1 Tax=Emticicia sp. W12TSBA100-4 TaxID=3160965 RepID=UPI003305BCD5